MITANGVSMNYSLEGPVGAPVLTLSHSLAADLSMWDPQMPALATRYRVLRYDTRGHGGTDAPAGPYSLGQLAEDAHALLAALDVDRTHWIGLSMGGMIGQTLALAAPDLFASLTLCDTTSRIPDEDKPMWAERIETVERQGLESLVEPIIGRWFTPRFAREREDVVDSVRAMIRATSAAGFAGCSHAISALDLTDKIAAFTLPTLIMVGEQDPGTPVAASRVMNERIDGSELVILKSASHLSNVEQPEAFTRALTTFLDRVT
jgi:3-oxoadipate enol-lactonase